MSASNYDSEDTKYNSIIQAKGISHFFSSESGKVTKCLDDINLDIKEQEFVGLVGPSGCGKSTLLNILAGLIKASEGEVFLKGEKYEGISSDIGYLSQSDALMPWRTVIENVELGLELKNIPKSDRREIVKTLIDKTGLGGFEDSYPSKLSGGMRKRVAIIRTLALNPKVLFMDEPFGPLDVFTKEILQGDILKLWEEDKKTIVFVTHDISEAITLSDRVVVMSTRPSRIKNIYDINLQRPRVVSDIRYDENFIRFHKSISKDLKVELLEKGEI